jgi:hypothetical protein
MKATLFLFALILFAFAPAASWAATIPLKGLYGRSVVAHDCADIGGEQTSGIGPNGYGCKTAKAEVTCNADGQCTATCDTCGTVGHHTGLYGILHARSKQ